jgi:PmbA protein
MADHLHDLTARMLTAARAAGADAADAVAVTSASVTVEVRGGALEQAERSEATEIGLRVIVGRRQACVAASTFGDRTLAEMAERAVAMAKAAPEDPTVGLADPAEIARDTDASALDLDDPGADPDPAALEDEARAAESAALAVQGVTRTESASARAGRSSVWLAATNGFSGGYRRAQSSLSVGAIAGEGTGMERDWAWETRIRRADIPPPNTIGRLAGERAVARLGARKPPTGAFPVLYDERVASSLIGHLVAAANGSAIVRGASWLRDALGEAVLPEGLTLTDDPRRVRAFASRPFDDEGLPTAAREIVADGHLTGWTLDLGTARRLGLKSTASASRGLSSPPSPATTNLALTQGAATRADLIAEMGTGLLVTSMLGSTINPTTGDYSRGASGFWVERGEIAYPVNECTIAGNLRDMLRTIRPANDARLHLSWVVPSLLVDGLTIAGA